MLFKDRADAGEKLANLLSKRLANDRDKVIVVSLLRGGVVVGSIIAKKLALIHLPLVVTKIPAPFQPELAIGGLCFKQTFLKTSVINSLGLTNLEINEQQQVAKTKFVEYCQRFNLKEKNYSIIKNKAVILVDDGVATGSTVMAARLFLKERGAKKIILAVPVAPTDFHVPGFNQIIIFHKDPYLSAISQFYVSFPQVEDEEVRKLLN